MGLFADTRTKTKFARAVQPIATAWEMQEIGHLVTAFRTALPIAREILAELEGKQSLSSVYQQAHENTRQAAELLEACCANFLASIVTEGDRLKSWHPEVAESCVRGAVTAFAAATSD
ncbi:hypothetical protein NF556_16445 [Ornithinimicrobium faecis]|uniref:Phasin domain-containing protein n=1 Tax=Ornithinimicrobium faecis TaxID=2934158 RepID=A0ABY4YRJ1_9MICO|nr:hypothetical protein [Ornithinimicrobium sp. HY1793]USQ79191.1 hypothetical protein NF556_16445 [Ornithinimicrobium sp. HY1793]